MALQTAVKIHPGRVSKNGCRVSRNFPHIFSFFSGAGLLDLGFEDEGLRVDYANEISAPFMNAYRYARECMGFDPPQFGFHLEDVSNLASATGKGRLKGLIRTARKNTDVIGFIAGPPCPDFSIGGRNRGRTGENGRLSQTYVELVCEQKPDFYLFENVKGLWSTGRHREFYEEIKLKTQEAGYKTTERLINSIGHGAPQDRDRIILIGFKPDLLSDLGIKTERASRVLPDDTFPWTEGALYSREKALGFPWPETNVFREGSKVPCPGGIPQELTVEYWFRKNDVGNHPNSDHCFKPRNGLARFKSVAEGDDSKKSFKRLHRWRYSPTACYGNNEVHLHPYKARRISVAEAMAIQSLPKEFAFPPDMTLSSMFKAVGNGVPYLAARSIAGAILKFLRLKK